MTVDVIVPYRSDGGHRAQLWEWCANWWAVRFPDYRIITADSGHDLFNRGASRNRAVRDSTADVLFIADADTFASPEAIAHGVEVVGDGMSWVIPYDLDRYYNLSEKATRDRLKFPADPAVPITEPWDSDDWEHKLTSWAGALIVRRVDYIAAGGYPEFPRWGYEDDCFRAALDMVAGAHLRVPGFCLHLWHPASEDDRFGNSDIEANRAVAMRYKRARTQRQMAALIAEHGGMT